MRRLLWLSIGFSIGLLPRLGTAHSNLQDGMQGTAQLGAAASLSYFSQGATDASGYWRINGALMGGHALPVEKGAGLDDALLWARYKLNPAWQVHAKVATHNEGDNSHTLTVDNLSLSRTHLFNQPVDVEVGLMDAAFAPSASTHPSTAPFTERPLLADVFWGGSIHDTGLRLTWQPLSKWKLGTELWSGDFFPASQGEGALSVFVQTEQQWGNWSLQSGIWGLQSSTQDRPDERYTAGHSHTTATTTLPDVRFSGDSDLNGIWLDLQTPTWRQIQPRLRYEWAQTKSTGELINLDQARKATYHNHYQGMALEPSVRIGQHELSYRYEKLALSNELSGTAAALIAEDANLLNSQTPKRQTLQWSWPLQPHLTARLAYSKDQSLVDDNKRWSVGIVWQQTLYDR